MKRTEDGSIKEKKEQIFSSVLTNNYLSRSVEFLKITQQQLESEYTNGSIWIRCSHDTRIKVSFKDVTDGSPNLFITVESNVAEFFNVVICQDQNFFSTGIQLKMQNGLMKGVLFAPLRNNGEPILDIENWLDQENKPLWIQLWKQDSEEEEVKKSMEFTDCVIHAQNGEQKFLANINILAISSKVIYNMIQDLQQQQQYSHENPVDLSEFFRGFEDHEIHMYLCFVYNPYCVLIELKQILSLLKISLKLDNQGLIQRIFNMDNLGSIIKESIIWCDEGSPCKVYNILNFAKQHDFHKLMIFCCLEIISEERRGEMAPFIEAYEDL